VAESISAELLLTRKKINTEANNPQIPFMPLALFLNFQQQEKHYPTTTTKCSIGECNQFFFAGVKSMSRNSKFRLED